jgi:hypothetical protein
VPRHAVLLDQHSWNVYLEAVPLLVRHPAWLERMTEFLPPVALVQMLAAKNLLGEGLGALFRREVADKAARHLENETFRQDSPAMALTSALLAVPAVRKCSRGAVAERLAAAGCGADPGPAALVDVLQAMLEHLERAADTAPPRNAADAMDHPEIALLRVKLATFLGS